MIDLGTLPGGSGTLAYGINNSGQVVGTCFTGDGDFHAFLYSGGAMTDLSSLVALPSGVSLNYAFAINDLGQIAATGSDGHAYLLTPVNTLSLKVLNPLAPYAQNRQAPPTLTVPGVLNSPTATSLAADGESAVVLAYQSKSPQPVTFAVSARGAGITSGTAVGSLGQFDVNYLAHPSPPSGNLPSYRVTAPTYGPDAAGTYTFLALLWAPNAMPANLVVTATQQGQVSTAQASVALEPPPLLLVHGIWSSRAGAWFTPDSQGQYFYKWISTQYHHNLIDGVNYDVPLGSTNLNALAFNDSRTQSILLKGMGDLLARAASQGMAARTVDVEAHSMGGLVTRYFLSTSGYLGNPAMLPKPVHKLITIGTPHLGTQFATTLLTYQYLPTWLTAVALASYPELASWCLPFGVCTLGGAISQFAGPVDTGVQSMAVNSQQLQALSPTNEFAAIIGQAPTSPESVTERLLDLLIFAFLPGQSVASILNQSNDTIVPFSSQSPSSVGQTDTAIFPGIVHDNLSSDVGETQSPAVRAQAYYWLTGSRGRSSAPSLGSSAAPTALTSTTTALPPILDFTGYTQVAASNVAFQPATGSVLTINTATNIAATSSTKTVTEVLLLQTVTDPTDTALLYATQSPFTIPFTPTRLGSANFGAIAVFSDNTYAMTTLTYTLLPSGSPYALNLVNAPEASMAVGASQVVRTDALFASGPVDVTQVATYAAGSGSTSVFSVSPGGTITANGGGQDLLNVSYGGVTATAPIAVSSCSYGLNPSNQIVPSTGGTATIQVATQPGCAWTATGGAAWLALTNATGSGNGAITLSAAANISGGTQGALVNLAGLTAVVTQPAAACSYGLSQTQIGAPAAGWSGTITVNTACPVTASSDQSWLTATPLGSSVAYTIAPNDGTSQRSATLTVGTVTVPVTQSGSTGQAPAAVTVFSPAQGATGVSTAASLSWGAVTGASSYNVYFGASTPPPLVTGTPGTSYSPTMAPGTTYYWSVTAVNLFGSAASSTWSFTTQATSGFQLVPVTPCRVMDTRTPTATFGGTITGGTTRVVPVPLSSCNISNTAQAYSLNITVVPHGTLNYLTIWPTGVTQPLVSTLNSLDGRIVANAAIVPAGTNGSISVFVSNTTDVVIDINGYFAPASTSGSMSFYSVTPCRIVDTRSANGAFGGPFMNAGSNRSFAIPNSSCNIPGTAQAYSLNMTVVPHAPLSYLTTWPTGQPQPFVSTLNSFDGSIVANAAIVPAGSNSAVSVFVTGDTDVIIDINGYFAAPGAAGALSLYTLTPCRVVDTRNAAGPFGGPSLPANGTRGFTVPSSSCSVPSNAQAYSLNVTVVPPGPLTFLTAWPSGLTQPLVSTLNSLAGKVVANVAIVPAGSSGAVSIFVSNLTDVILDINAYFAQ